MELETAIKGIVAQRETIHREHQWSDPIALSDTMTKLSVYNAYLADHIALLHKEATDKSYAVYTEARADGTPQGTAEQMSRGESTSQRELYEKVKNIYTATGNLISVLQSRLRVIENQRRQEDA